MLFSVLRQQQINMTTLDKSDKFSLATVTTDARLLPDSLNSRFSPLFNSSSIYQNKPSYHQQTPITFAKDFKSLSMIGSDHIFQKPTNFGKLESMARKTTIQQTQQVNPIQISKKSAFLSTSMVIDQTNLKDDKSRFVRMKPYQKTYTETSENIQQKRRDSIDLGVVNLSSSTTNLGFLKREQKTQQQKNAKQVLVNNNRIAESKNSLLRKPSFLNKKSQNNDQKFGFQSLQILPKANLTNDLKCPQVPQIQKSLFQSSQIQAPRLDFQFKKKRNIQQKEKAASKNFQDFLTTFQKKNYTFKFQERELKYKKQISLSDFEIIKKIGKGALGQVFLAKEKYTGFICVLKKLSKQQIKDLKVQQHTLREIKIQFFVKHPQLTTLYGCFDDQTNIYLILEALPDGSLQQVKRKKKIPQKQTANIVRQVAQGLRYLHAQSILHRDIKPQNIFVYENIVKLGDFGCSIYNKNSTLRKTLVGCLQYSSPEQLSKQGYDQKIDSWSLGVLTYELLYGKSPFEKDIRNIRQNNGTQMKPQLSKLIFPETVEIQPKTKQFIQKLLQEEPIERMCMNEVLQHPFINDFSDEKSKSIQD